MRVWEGGIEDAKDCSVSWDGCSTGGAFTADHLWPLRVGVGGSRAEEVKRESGGGLMLVVCLGLVL